MHASTTPDRPRAPSPAGPPVAGVPSPPQPSRDADRPADGSDRATGGQSPAGTRTPRTPRAPRITTRDDGVAAEDVAIRMQGVSFWYGDNQALEDITLDCPRHHITALIGPSGCGKSTLLRCLNRMNDLIEDTRLAGSIRMEGTDIHGEGVDPVALRRHVGMVFQKPNPFPKSIFENVAYGLRLHQKLGRGELAERVEWALRKAHLWDEVKDRIDAPATGLSGGQQQRLCIARALAVEPRVLLMDEPCSALDPVATQKVEDLMVELKRDVTIVIVTHSMSQAARVSDRTAFLYKGKLVEVGRTRSLFEAPREELTEQYITGRFG